MSTVDFVTFQIKTPADRARFIEVLSSHYKDVEPSVVSALVESVPNRGNLLAMLAQMQAEAAPTSSAVTTRAAPAAMSAAVVGGGAAFATSRAPAGGAGGSDLFGFGGGGGSGAPAGNAGSRRITTQQPSSSTFARAAPAARAAAPAKNTGAKVDLDALFSAPPAIPPASNKLQKPASPVAIWPAADPTAGFGPSLYGPPPTEEPELSPEAVASPSGRGPSVPKPPPSPSPPRAPDAKGNAPPPPPPPHVRVAPHAKKKKSGGGLLGWLGFGGSGEAAPNAAAGGGAQGGETLDDLFVANGAPAAASGGGSGGAAGGAARRAQAPTAGSPVAAPAPAPASKSTAPGLLTPEQVAEMLAMANQQAAATRRGEDDPNLARFSERAAAAVTTSRPPAVPATSPSAAAGGGSKKINPADRPGLFNTAPTAGATAATGAMMKQFGVDDDHGMAARPSAKVTAAAAARPPPAARASSGVDDLLQRFERDGDFNGGSKAASPAVGAPPAVVGMSNASSYDFASTGSAHGASHQAAPPTKKQEVSVDDLLSKFM